MTHNAALKLHLRFAIMKRHLIQLHKASQTSFYPFIKHLGMINIRKVEKPKKYSKNTEKYTPKKKTREFHIFPLELFFHLFDSTLDFVILFVFAVEPETVYRVVSSVGVEIFLEL